MCFEISSLALNCLAYLESTCCRCCGLHCSCSVVLVRNSTYLPFIIMLDFSPCLGTIGSMQDISVIYHLFHGLTNVIKNWSREVNHDFYWVTPQTDQMQVDVVSNCGTFQYLRWGTKPKTYLRQQEQSHPIYCSKRKSCKSMITGQMRSEKFFVVLTLRIRGCLLFLKSLCFHTKGNIIFSRSHSITMHCRPCSLLTKCLITALTRNIFAHCGVIAMESPHTRSKLAHLYNFPIWLSLQGLCMYANTSQGTAWWERQEPWSGSAAFQPPAGLHHFLCLYQLTVVPSEINDDNNSSTVWWLLLLPSKNSNATYFGPCSDSTRRYFHVHHAARGKIDCDP